MASNKDEEALPLDDPSATPVPFSVEASAPQVIRLTGLHQILSENPPTTSPICIFSPTTKVPCRCDTTLGTLECDVPRTLHTTIPHTTSTFTVKAAIASYQTPPLSIRYHISPQLPPPPKAPTVSPTLHTRFLARLSRNSLRAAPSSKYKLLHQCIAEMIGTMIIVIIGVGSVCTAVLTNTSVGLWQIATVWGFGVALAILCTASVSGAHLNPAVSLAFAMFRPNAFSFAKLLPYWFAQYLGGVLGGAFNLLVFGSMFRHFEKFHDIVRGEPKSVLSAKAFGEYFPDPGLTTLVSESYPAFPPEIVSPAFAMFVEAWGTGILMFVILALTDPRQKLLRNKELLAFYIGFTVAVLITLYAPITQAGWNPARDFGPRIVAALAGWGRIAIPGPRNGFWVYIIGPKIGAPVGALVYDLLINPGLVD